MKQNDLFMDSSILYRTTQKYFDRELQQFQLTYAQLPVLIMVYENEGISMQEIAFQGKYDKGTITKNVQKLESLGYLEVIHSSKDKRSKELYTTLKAKENVTDGDACLRAVVEDVQVLLKQEREILSVAAEIGDDGTQDVFSSYVSSQEKLLWMLYAYLNQK